MTTFLKHPLTLAVCATLSAPVFAAPSSYGPIGPNIGYGDSSNPSTIYHPLANPADNALNAADTEGWRFGLGANLQASAVLNGMEGSSNYYDDNIEPFLDSNTVGDIANLQNNVNEFLRRYNGGHFSTISGVTIPLMLKSEALGGGLTLDYTRHYGSSGQIIRKNDVTATYSGNLSINQGDAAFGLTYKELDEFALGYGTDLISGKAGSLSLGVTARYLSLMSNAKVLDMKQIVDDNVGGQSKDTADYIEDMDQGQSDNNITADIGINWVTSNFMLGVIGMNLTEPTFDVNNKSTAQATSDFGEYLPSKFKLESQYRVVTQLYTDSRHWTLAGSYDLKKSNNLNDEDVQWWTASASWASNSYWYVPDVRFGLRGNLVGNEYTYGTVGLTVGPVIVDLAATTLDLKGVSDEQKDAGVMASVGVEFDF